MYTYPAIVTNNHLFLAKPKKIKNKTSPSLQDLDASSKIEMWWDRQVCALAEHFTTNYPKARLEEWNKYLQDFIEDTIRFEVEDPLSDSEELSKSQLEKWDYLNIVFALLQLKTERQFSSIEKVKANWRFDHNKTFVENLSCYFAHREFLVNVSVSSDVFDITRSCDNLHYFLGTDKDNLSEVYPLPQAAQNSFYKLIAKWPVLYKNFMSGLGPQADFNEAINGKDLTLDAIDPKGEFRKWWKAYGNYLENNFSLNIKSFLDAIYPDQINKDAIYQSESFSLKSSYLATFFQFFLVPILGSARYKELKEIKVDNLTAEQNTELDDFENKFTYLLKLISLLQKESLVHESALARKSSDNFSIASSNSSLIEGSTVSFDSISSMSFDDAASASSSTSTFPDIEKSTIKTRDQVIDTALSQFQFTSKPSKDLQINWVDTQFRVFHQHLFTVMPSGKFRIQEMLEEHQPLTGRKLFEDYNEYQNKFYAILMEAFQQKIQESFTNNSDYNPIKVKAEINAVYAKFNEQLMQTIETNHKQEKSNFLGSVKSVYAQASKIPLASLATRHFSFLDQLNKAELSLINDFYRKKQLRSPAEYKSFREGFMEAVNSDTQKALQLEKPRADKILKVSPTFHTLKDKLEKAFDTAQAATVSSLKQIKEQSHVAVQEQEKPEDKPEIKRSLRSVFSF